MKVDGEVIGRWVVEGAVRGFWREKNRGVIDQVEKARRRIKIRSCPISGVRETRLREGE